MLGLAVAHRSFSLIFVYPRSTFVPHETRVDLVRPSPRRAAPAPTFGRRPTTTPSGAAMSLSNRKTHSTNLAGRMGRWSAHHRKIAIFGWLAFVIAAFAIGMFVIGSKQATSASGPGESGRM